jgi:tetratricopeptide (TPR) repeat protein
MLTRALRIGGALLCLSALTIAAAAGDAPRTNLAKAWGAFYAGNHGAAVKQTDSLMKHDDRALAIEAACLQARSYWAQGNRAGQVRAFKLWKQLSKLDSPEPALASRLVIAEALQLEAAGDEAKLKQATDSLESILKENRLNLATPEAAVVLGDIHRRAGQFDEARKAYQFAIDLLSDKQTLRKMELADGSLVRPHLQAARRGLTQQEVDRDAGRAEFEAAQHLRRQEKFREAYRAYRAVANDFPDSDYAPRSELHMGDCMVGLGETARAIRHWKAFIKPEPAGPWRAQAYIKIIDYCLEEQLNLPEAGRYAELARASLPTAVADEQAGPSWQAAGFDVQIRVGIVKFCECSLKKAAVAAQAFQAAQKLADNKETAERMAKLIKAAESGKPVIPTDCQADNAASGEGKVSLVLSMGTIYMVAGRWDRADECFDRILGTPHNSSPAGRGKGEGASRPRRSPRRMRGASKAQQAFAIFGRGAVLHHHRKTDQAVEQFLASLKACPDGTWHDETLYRIASIKQDDAEAKFDLAAANAAYGQPGARRQKSGARSKKPAAGKRNTGNNSSPSGRGKGEGASAEIRKQKSDMESQRLAARAKAFQDVLPYWQEIIERYPESPRIEPAMYNKGLLLYEIADAADGTGQSRTKAEQAWETALDALSRFTNACPQSPLAGDAYVKQVDIAMERLLRLQLAQRLSSNGIEWVDARANGRASGMPDPEVAWAMRTVLLPEDCIEDASLAIVGRNAFIFFVDGQEEQAKKQLQRLRPLLTSQTDGSWNNYDRLKWGFDHGYLYAYPYELSMFQGKQRLAVLLADYHYVTMNFERAASIAKNLLDGKCGRLTSQQAGYVSFLYGAAICWLGEKQAGLDSFRAAFGSVTPTSKEVSLTQERAMYAAARVAISLPDEDSRVWGLELLRQLAACSRINNFTSKAKIAYATVLLEEGKTDKGMAILEKLSQTDSIFGRAAEAYLDAYRQGRSAQQQ